MLTFSHYMFKRGNEADLVYIRREAIKNKKSTVEEEGSIDFLKLMEERERLRKDLLVNETKTKEKELKLRSALIEKKKELKAKDLKLLKLLHLVFKSRGLFDKNKIGKGNKEGGFLRRLLEREESFNEHLSILLSSVESIDGFADRVYSVLKEAILFDSIAGSPYKVEEEDGIKLIVKAFGRDSRTQFGGISSKREDKDLIGQSNFRTYVRESEGNLRGNMSEFFF